MISWQGLRLTMPADTARPEVHEVIEGMAPQRRILQARAADECAHHLRVYASSLPAADELDDELCKSFVGDVLVLQRMSDDLDVGGARRLTQHLRHHAIHPRSSLEGLASRRKLYYNTAFLLHACLMAHFRWSTPPLC